MTDAPRGHPWWQRCRWDVIGSVYQPPKSFDFGGGIAPHWLEDLVFGFTTLTLRCSVCGAVRTRIERGKATGHAN